MTGPPVRRWVGTSDGEPWTVEIEIDRFTETEPFVASICTSHEDDDGKRETLAAPSAEQAREMAAVLLVVADSVDANNARVAAPMTGTGPCEGDSAT